MKLRSTCHRKFGAVAIASLVASTSFAANYTVTVLKDLPSGAGALVAGINDAGQTVGTAGSSYSIAVIWNGSTPMAVLGSKYIQAFGIAINAGGVIVGGGDDGPFVASSAKAITFLPANFSSTIFAPFASAINTAGDVVGADFPVTSTSVMHATLWTGTLATNYSEKDLGALTAHGNSQASGINDLNQVVGTSDTAGGASHAVLWNGKSTLDLGTLGGKNSAAVAINASSRIVGWADTAAGGQHAALWNRGAVEDLGTLGGASSSASAINSRGDVVGASQHSGCCTTHAVLWPTDSNAIIDLNTEISAAEAKEYTLTAAVGINDKGQIAVTGYDNKTFASYSFVLTPTTPISCTIE